MSFKHIYFNEDACTGCNMCQRELIGRGYRLDTLSMGMSGDLDAAIAAGATLVRVGTALFGARPSADASSG